MLTYLKKFLGIALFLFVGIGWTLFIPAHESRAEVVNLTLVHTNDIYNVEYDINEARGGFAHLATVVKKERQGTNHVLFTHAGDTFSPSLLSGFDQGEHIVALTNHLNPDVFVPGNHEFDFGEHVFRQHIADATFPIFAANLRDEEGQKIQPLIDGRIYTFGSAKVGVLGLAADDSPVKSSPGTLKFGDTVNVGIATAKVLRDNGADIIIAVAHASRSRDQELFQSGAFDIILSGDDHDLMLFYDGKTLMLESGEEAETVSIVDLAINVDESDGRRRVSWRPQFRLIDTATVTPDEETLALVQEYASRLSSELDQDIGTSATPLDSRRSAVRGEETAIGNLIADAIRDDVGADVAIMNGGGIRGNKEYPANTTLSRRDILTELPFGNKAVKLEISGKDLLAALENGFSQIEDGAGRYPQVSGMTVTVDLSLPPMERVLSVNVNGKSLDKTSTYTLGTNNYIAGGGDGYANLKDARVILGDLDGKFVANIVIDYIQQSQSVSPIVEGRIND